MHYVKFKDSEGDLRICYFLPSEIGELLIRLKELRSEGVEFTHEFVD